ELFLARPVEMKDLGDSGHVAKEPQIVDLALLPGRRGIVERGLGRPAHLSLYVLDELLDPRSRRNGLLVLDPDEPVLRLLVGKVEVDRATGQKHTADEEEEDDDVLPEQPAARVHRRSMSARRRTFRGTVIPRRAAVFRFTARSILSAPSTGRSWGRVPRRIFATRREACTP